MLSGRHSMRAFAMSADKANTSSIDFQVPWASRRRELSEVERLARRVSELADTGVDITSLGNAPAPAGCAAWTR